MKQRNEAILLNTLNNILKYDINSNKLKNFSITYVSLSKDKKYCDVYIDYWNLKELDSIIDKLNKEKGVFRKLLSQKLDLFKTPELVFKKDKTIEASIKMEELLKKIK